MRTLVVLALLTPALVWAVPAESKTDAERLLGEWIVEEAAFDEDDQDEIATPKGSRIVFAKDKSTITTPNGEKAFDGVYSINPAARPKRMEFGFAESVGGGSRVGGLYELNGDTLRLCFGTNGGPRPPELKAGKGTKAILITLKRVKAKE